MSSDDLRKTVATNIKKFRKINHLTLAALAERANLSVGYLCDLESGKKWGMPETITKITQALHIQPFQLFIEEENIDNDILAMKLEQILTILKGNMDTEFIKLIKSIRMKKKHYTK